MPMRKPLTFAVVTTLAAATMVVAQEEGREAPNQEPSSFDTLFDRSDTGNVAQQAQMAYGAGVRELKRAAKLEAKLAELDGEKAEKTRGKIAAAYDSAAESFQSAIRSNPKLIDAYVGLDEALRLGGKPQQAIQVSARGLQLAPDNDQLFGGWAAAVLALDMLGDATQAYATLKQTNPARAAVLMGLMKAYHSEKTADPGSLDPAAVTQLGAWIAAQGG